MTAKRMTNLATFLSCTSMHVRGDSIRLRWGAMPPFCMSLTTPSHQVLHTLRGSPDYVRSFILRIWHLLPTPLWTGVSTGHLISGRRKGDGASYG